jgi:hypothetical protein
MIIEIKPVVRTAEMIDISLTINKNNSVSASVCLYKTNSIMETYSVVIEGAEYDAWGSDDNYIYDLILSKLGFERA